MRWFTLSFEVVNRHQRSLRCEHRTMLTLLHYRRDRQYGQTSFHFTPVKYIAPDAATLWVSSQQEPTLSADLMEEGVANWLNGVENPLAQKRKSRFSIHGAFDEFQFRHLSLDLSVVDGPSEARFHRRFVLLHSSSKWLKFC